MKYGWIDEFLLKMPGVTKDLQKDWNWIRYQIGGKMFAAICLDDHDKPYYITLKLEPMEGDFWRKQYEDIIPGYYMNKTHWNSVKADGNVPADLSVKIAGVAAGSVSKTTMYNNIFFDKDTDKVKKFVSDMGFDLEVVPMSRYMPEELASYKSLPRDIAAKATAAIGETNFWIMTAKPGFTENLTCEEENFKADVRLNGNTLDVSLAGRLDTLTAPGLLALYREAQSKGGYQKICIDMKELEYISSAGLRVLLIMRKDLTDNDSFDLINMNDSVKEIINTTGFNTIFC